MWFQRLEMNRYQTGKLAVTHRGSIHRWLDHVLPHCMTGNKDKSELVQTYLVLLVGMSIVVSEQDGDVHLQ